MKELKIDVFGRVQGVGFRQYVKKTADVLGVKGHVKNLSDGRVSILAQGSREVLCRLLQNVQGGSFLSKVSGMTYLWREPSKVYSDFVITVDKPFILDQKASFTNLGKKLLNLDKAIPRHVAIIPDGNRRWAREKLLPATEGHRIAGSKEHMLELLRTFKELGISYFSLWVFSTENWNRDKGEVSKLLSLFEQVLRELRPDFMKEQVRFRHLGRKDRLPLPLQQEIDSLEEATKEFNRFNLQLCLDYGGRDELTRAINKMLHSGVKEINEEDVSRFLDTEGIPDPDLIIRTSGEQRMSGFMPYQGTYAEFYFASIHFPDFGSEQLREAVDEFSRRKRNFGS